MRRIIEHLLKLEHSPAAEPRCGWRRSDHRGPRRDFGRSTATLRRDAEAALELLYQQSRRRAKAALPEHGERDAAKALPTTCPYSFDQIVTQDWYPANRHGIVDDIANA